MSRITLQSLRSTTGLTEHLGWCWALTLSPGGIESSTLRKTGDRVRRRHQSLLQNQRPNHSARALTTLPAQPPASADALACGRCKDPHTCLGGSTYRDGRCFGRGQGHARQDRMASANQKRPATVKQSRADVDAALQRLLAALKNAGIPEKTLVVSDVEQGREREMTDRQWIFKGSSPYRQSG